MLGILEDGRGNNDRKRKEIIAKASGDRRPTPPIAANNLAWLIVDNSGQPRRSLAALQRAAVFEEPNRSPSITTRSVMIYLKKGLYPTAVEQFKKAVAFDEANAAKKRNGSDTRYIEFG